MPPKRLPRRRYTRRNTVVPMGNEFHRRAESGRTHHHEDHAGHHGGHEEAIDAVLRDDCRHDDHEGARGTANLEVGSAEG